MILQAEEALGGLISTLILISSPICIKYLIENIIVMSKYYANR